MATWQFDVFLIPGSESALLASGEFTAETFADHDWWRGRSLPPDGLAEMIKALPLAQSWSPEIETWGEEEGNRIDITTSDEGLEEVRVRFDARNIDRGFVSQVVSLAIAADCVVVTEAMDVIPPLVAELEAAIRDSDARRFVRDPKEFLDGLEEREGG